MKKYEEQGITNLGAVPPGMSYSQAVALMKSDRKYIIDPYEGGHRMTLCDTARMAWREVDKLPNCAEKQQLYEYIGAMFDYGKRMDARMKELKGKLNQYE